MQVFRMFCSQVCRGDTETDGEGGCTLAPSGANESQTKAGNYSEKNHIQGSIESGAARASYVSVCVYHKSYSNGKVRCS